MRLVFVYICTHDRTLRLGSPPFPFIKNVALVCTVVRGPGAFNFACEPTHFLLFADDRHSLEHDELAYWCEPQPVYYLCLSIR